MDLQTCLISIALVILSGVALFFISVFGIQEKSYEEAIAEQRKMPNEALLLGRPVKNKIKNKKSKNQGKKRKEKASNNNGTNTKNKLLSKVVPHNKKKPENKTHDHTHVNFLNPEAKILNEVKNIVEPDKKNKKIKEKLKPILVNKEESKITKMKQIPKDVKINHFRETIPKDDLQLKLSINKININSNNSSQMIKKESKEKEKSIVKVPFKENKNSKADNNKSKLKNTEKINNGKLQKEKTQNNEKHQKEKILNSEKQQKEKIQNNEKQQKEKIQNNEKHQKEKILNSEKQQKEKIQNNEKQQKEKIQNNEKQQKEKIQNEKQQKEKIQNEKQQKEKIQNNEKQQKEKIQNNEKQQKEKILNSEKQQKEKIQNNEKPQKTSQNNLKEIKVKIKSNVKTSENTAIYQKKVNSNQILSNKESKNKKNKKNEFCLQQISERDGINMNILISLIQKAELSHSEVQLLTDVLLTKYLDEGTDQFEWIEGRQDPVFKLKKQLAEKEKSLLEEQQASQAFQNKLKELRLEYNAERSRLTQACRQYDESIVAKQAELQNLHATNRHLMDTHVAEKQALTQKIQQLQAQVTDENMLICKLQEDHNQTQNALQQELVNQRQQMEIHIGRLSEQLKEAQKNFEAQIHNKIQEVEQIRASFNAEIQKTRRNEEELRELREQDIQNQAKIKTLESRASQLEEFNSTSQEMARKIEELQRINKDLEKNLNNSYQSEKESEYKKNQLQNEICGLTSRISELEFDYEKLLKEREKLLKEISIKMDLEKSFLKVKEENQCLISQVSAFTKIEKEALQLREENENLAAQMTAFTERPAADGRENGDSPCNEDKKIKNLEFINHEDKSQDVIVQLENELKEKENLLDKLNLELGECHSEIKSLSSKSFKFKTEAVELREKLETKKKNNERLLQEQSTTRHLLERIFPTIKINEKAYEGWLLQFEKEIKNYLQDLTMEKKKCLSSDHYNSAYLEELENKNNQLQNLVVHYKTIIVDTEGMLNKLQNHVEQEEIRWRQQYEALEPQIQILKDKLTLVENTNEKLESKIKELEEKGGGDADFISREKYLDFDRLPSLKTSKLKEEIEMLNLKLKVEEEKNQKLIKELIDLRNSVNFEEGACKEETKAE